MATKSPSASIASLAPRTKLLAALRKSDSSDSSESSADTASEASDSEDAPPKIIRPLYKPRNQPRTQSPDDDVEVDAESAYQRMKQRLAAEKELQEQPAQEMALDLAATIESDEDDSMPVQKPVRRTKVEMQKSPSQHASSSPHVRSRQPSPGLFVSPGPSPIRKRSQFRPSAGSDSDKSSPRASAADLQERVKRIRAERLAKQQEQAAQLARQSLSTQAPGQDAGSDSDGEVDRRLTQQAKPTRRAGKKAMEAMARDQQRISRNMQLTHQAKTKKKYSTKDLFTRFGFHGPDEKMTTEASTLDKTTTLVSSDVEAHLAHDTPPTSPSCQDVDTEKAEVEISNLTPKAVRKPSTDDTTPVPTKVDKGKGRAPEFAHLPTRSWPLNGQRLVVQRAQASDVTMVELSDSEEDAKALPKSRFAVFDRLQTKGQDESKSFVTLRHLAHLTSPKNTRKGPNPISRSEMNFSLAQKARQQAQRVREERVEELKRRGIHIETAEEREKHQMEVEDMVAQFEKQRQEDLKLAKQEKKQAKANGELADELPSSDESDEDFVGSDEENAAEGDDEDQDEDEDEDDELELSGSEDEPMEAEEKEDLVPADGSIERVAKENTPMPRAEKVVDDEDEPSVLPRRYATKRARRVIDDEEESDSEDLKLGSPTQEATQDKAKAAFGFSESSTEIGLTQMFAGTMANLDDTQATYQEPEQDSLDFLRSLPDTQPGVRFSQAHDTLVPNSQLFVSPRKESQAEAESQFSLGIDQLVGPSPSRTQFSEAPEPTQDAGFSFTRSPAGFMVPNSTVETVMMSVAESPLKRRTGKLQRGRREAMDELSDVEEDLVHAVSDLSDVDDIQRPPKHKDAFRTMQKGAKKQRAIDDFNKKNSAAKDVVQEQADESEDEYAGIGGASDDDSGEEDEELKNMIDHNDIKVDERQIAAFYA